MAGERMVWAENDAGKGGVGTSACPATAQQRPAGGLLQRPPHSVQGATVTCADRAGIAGRMPDGQGGRHAKVEPLLPQQQAARQRQAKPTATHVV